MRQRALQMVGGSNHLHCLEIRVTLDVGQPFIAEIDGMEAFPLLFRLKNAVLASVPHSKSLKSMPGLGRLVQLQTSTCEHSIELLVGVAAVLRTAMAQRVQTAP